MWLQCGLYRHRVHARQMPVKQGELRLPNGIQWKEKKQKTQDELEDGAGTGREARNTCPLTLDEPDWQAATKLVTEREYHRSLDHLEGLVVACLFELSKMNRVGIGKSLLFSSISFFLWLSPCPTGINYAKHIATALQQQSAMIWTALEYYITWLLQTCRRFVDSFAGMRWLNTCSCWNLTSFVMYDKTFLLPLGHSQRLTSYGFVFQVLQG